MSASRWTLSNLILLFTMFILGYWVFLKPFHVKHNQLIVLQKGWSLTHIGHELDEKKIWHYPFIATNTLRLASWFMPVQAGEYMLKPGMTLGKFTFDVVTGHHYLHQITFVPGQTLTQMAASLRVAEGLAAKEVLDNLDTLAKQVLGPEHMAVALEGALYPDTYAYEKGENVVILLKRAHMRWIERMQALWQAHGKQSPYASFEQAAIVASLIEKEASLPEERRKIAGVIANRLKKHMPLQIDATVIYGLGDQYHGKLTHKMMKVKSPYNTYKHKNLPPTPIAIFSEDALLAALLPEKHDFLYYVLAENKRHTFSVNYDDHMNALRKK